MMQANAFSAVALLATVIVLSFEGSAFAARRAFVVGIHDYTWVNPNPQPGHKSHIKLEGPKQDAPYVAAVLRKYRFSVSSPPQDQTHKTALRLAWAKFVSAVAKDDEVVIYYSGHGVSVNNLNFLVPRDIDPTKIDGADPRATMLGVDEMIQDVQAKSPRLVIWILDACRDNDKDLRLPNSVLSSRMPFPSSRHLILYSAPDTFSSPDPKLGSGENSIYTRHLLKNMQATPAIDILKGFARDTQVEVAEYYRKLNPELADASPEIRGTLGQYWCLQNCVATLVAANMDNGVRVARAANNKGLADSRVVSHRDRRQNAIFLGRHSTAGTECEENKPERHPLGCAVVNAALAGRTREIIGKKLTTQIGVNVRKRAPIVRRARADQYSCPVEMLAKGTTITLTGVISLTYDDGDAFYWGTIASHKDCLPKLKV